MSTSTSKDVMLTTVDNPYDPFNDFDHWYQYDVSHGYDTCGYLARVAKTSTIMTDAERDYETERAMDEIVKVDPFAIYRKIYK